MPTRAAAGLFVLMLAMGACSTVDVLDPDFADAPIARGADHVRAIIGDHGLDRDSLFDAVFVKTFGGRRTLTILAEDDDGVRITLVLPLRDPGTFPIAPTSFARASVSIGFVTWEAVADLGSGFITVNTVRRGRVSGTFEFVGEPRRRSFTLGRKIVTEGSFDVTF